MDFICSYDEALSAEHCKSLITKFERDRSKAPGMTGHGYMASAKNSLDITISNEPGWATEVQVLAELTERYLVQYIRQYPHLMTGAVSLSVPNLETGQPMPITDEVLAVLDDDVVLQLVRKVYRLGTINLQRYTRKEGGYHHFHSEIYPSMYDPDCTALHRVLLFMYYLNDVREGGETEFLYQARKLQPRKGQLVFAPAGFTHTHKGHVPISNDKYILTSWVLFRPAAEIYANQLPA